MSKLPIVNAKQLDRRYTTIPHHPDEDLSRTLIKTILNQIEISSEEFIQLLNK